jgi:hypothetical protein
MLSFTLLEGLYPSIYDIGDKVEFIPMIRHCIKYKIDEESYIGVITSIKFTFGKVFYTIVDDYYGYLFENVDSAKVLGKLTTLQIKYFKNYGE